VTAAYGCREKYIKFWVYIKGIMDIAKNKSNLLDKNVNKTMGLPKFFLNWFFLFFSLPDNNF